MKNKLKGRIKVKKILIIFLILIGLYWIFNDLLRFDWLPLGNDEQLATVTDEIDLINIDISSASTTIIPENRSNIEAELTGQGKVKVEKHGNEITVSVKRKWFHILPFERKKLTIYIPRDYEESMKINLGSGNLVFSDTAVKDPMKLKQLTINIGSGNLKLSHLDVQQFVENLSSGNVKIDTLTTKSGNIDVSSGNLEIKNYLGGLDAELSSGELSIQMDKLVDDIKMQVSSGSAELDLPNDADFILNGQTSSGNVTCDFPLKAKETSNKTIHGTYGSGKHNIDLQVSSGNIRIH